MWYCVPYEDEECTVPCQDEECTVPCTGLSYEDEECTVPCQLLLCQVRGSEASGLYGTSFFQVEDTAFPTAIAGWYADNHTLEVKLSYRLNVVQYLLNDVLPVRHV